MGGGFNWLPGVFLGRQMSQLSRGFIIICMIQYDGCFKYTVFFFVFFFFVFCFLFFVFFSLSHNDSANLLLFCMINVMFVLNIPAFTLCHNELAEIAARIKLSHDDLAKLSYKIWKSPNVFRGIYG